MNAKRVFQVPLGGIENGSLWSFGGTMRQTGGMDKKEHGKRLAAAMATKGLERQAVADAVGRGVRTITNWTSGNHMPNPQEREMLRSLFPGYDLDGDPVEVAVKASTLTADRQHAVIGYYLKQLREQGESNVS